MSLRARRDKRWLIARRLVQNRVIKGLLLRRKALDISVGPASMTSYALFFSSAFFSSVHSLLCMCYRHWMDILGRSWLFLDMTMFEQSINFHNHIWIGFEWIRIS